MKRTAILGSLCLLSAGLATFGVSAAEEKPERPVAHIDDFSAPEISPLWVQHYKPDQFTQEDGILVGKQLNPNHGATLRVFLQDMADVSFSFDARLSGGAKFNAVMGDPDMRGVSHAGHIARLNVNNDGTIWLSDDLRGLMKIGHRDLPPAERREAIKEHIRIIEDMPLDDGEWHSYRFEIRGETAQVYVDGALVAELTSPGFAHPGKKRFGFSVNNGEAHFDNMRLVSPQT